jgi:uncharacterized membrane protein YqjE
MTGDTPAGHEMSAAGLMQSLRGLADTALAILATRAELLVSEIEEERLRILRLLLWGALALLFFGFGLLMLTFALVVLFWDTHRLLVVVVTGVIYLAIAVGCAVCAGRGARRPRLFDASLRELAKDRDALRPE